MARVEEGVEEDVVAVSQCSIVGRPAACVAENGSASATRVRSSSIASNVSSDHLPQRTSNTPRSSTAEPTDGVPEPQKQSRLARTLAEGRPHCPRDCIQLYRQAGHEPLEFPAQHDAVRNVGGRFDVVSRTEGQVSQRHRYSMKLTNPCVLNRCRMRQSFSAVRGRGSDAPSRRVRTTPPGTNSSRPTGAALSVPVTI